MKAFLKVFLPGDRVIPFIKDLIDRCRESLIIGFDPSAPGGPVFISSAEDFSSGPSGPSVEAPGSGAPSQSLGQLKEISPAIPVQELAQSILQEPKGSDLSAADLHHLVFGPIAIPEIEDPPGAPASKLVLLKREIEEARQTRLAAGT